MDNVRLRRRQRLAFIRGIAHRIYFMGDAPGESTSRVFSMTGVIHINGLVPSPLIYARCRRYRIPILRKNGWAAIPCSAYSANPLSGRKLKGVILLDTSRHRNSQHNRLCYCRRLRVCRTHCYERRGCKIEHKYIRDRESEF